MIECNNSRRSLEAKKNVSHQKSRRNKGFSLLSILNNDVRPEQNETLRLNYKVHNLKSSQSLIGIVCCGNEKTKKKLHVSIVENVTYKNGSPTLVLLRQNSDLDILNCEESTASVNDCHVRKRWTDAAVSNAELDFEKELQVSLHSSSEYIAYTSDIYKSTTEERKPNYPQLTISKVQKGVRRRHKSRPCKNCARKNSPKTTSANLGHNQRQTLVYHSAVPNGESLPKEKEDCSVDFNDFLEKIAKAQKNASMLSNIDDLSKRINHLDKLLNDTIIRTYTDRVLKDKSFSPVKRKNSTERNICHFSRRKQQEAIYDTIFKHKPTVMRPLKQDVVAKNYYYDQLLPVSINLANMNFITGTITSGDTPNYYYGQFSATARINNEKRQPSQSDDSSELSSETSSSESDTETSSSSASCSESSCCSHSSCDCKGPFPTVLIKSSSEVNLRTGTIKKRLKVLCDRGDSSRSVEIRG